MEKPKIGDKLKIHCYKHNGKIHRTWDEATVIEVAGNLLICGNNKVKVTQSSGRTHNTKEVAIIFFYENRWFNTFALFKKKGIFYKSNIASPYLIDEDIIKFIDYDLDLKVFPDGTYKVLDQNEYKYHKKIMKYSEDLDKVIKSELEELINMKETESGPFSEEVINKYHQKYILMLEKESKTNDLV